MRVVRTQVYAPSFALVVIAMIVVEQERAAAYAADDVAQLGGAGAAGGGRGESLEQPRLVALGLQSPHEPGAGVGERLVVHVDGVLGGEHQADAEGPGLLPLQRLQQWRPQGSLLVLTACSSADGRVRRGEGTQSLARAFLQAGSPQVLAALWPLGDAASAEFNRYFYESLSASGRPATALAEAQRRMRDSARWRQPANWAGMVLYDALPAR